MANQSPRVSFLIDRVVMARKFLLNILAAVLTVGVVPNLSHAQSGDTLARSVVANTEDLSAKDIDRMLFEDSDNGAEDAMRRLKKLNRELESASSPRLERHNSSKMARTLKKRLTRAEVVDYNAADVTKKKRR
jgi:hypothetical protein